MAWKAGIKCVHVCASLREPCLSPPPPPLPPLLPSVCLCLSVCLPLCLSVCLCLSLCFSLSFSVSVSVSVCLSLCLCPCLSLFLSLPLSLSPLSLSLSPSISLPLLFASSFFSSFFFSSPPVCYLLTFLVVVFSLWKAPSKMSFTISRNQQLSLRACLGCSDSTRRKRQLKPREAQANFGTSQVHVKSSSNIFDRI